MDHPRQWSLTLHIDHLHIGDTRMSEKLDQILQALADQDAGLATIGTNIENIAGDVTFLKQQIAQGGTVTEADLDQVLEKLTGSKSTIDALAQRTSDIDSQTP